MPVCILWYVLIQVLEHLRVDHLPPEEQNKHVVRIGFSAPTTSLSLGNALHSSHYYHIC